jgi:hypothetical protein
LGQRSRGAQDEVEALDYDTAHPAHTEARVIGACIVCGEPVEAREANPRSAQSPWLFSLVCSGSCHAWRRILLTDWDRALPGSIRAQLIAYICQRAGLSLPIGAS